MNENSLTQMDMDVPPCRLHEITNQISHNTQAYSERCSGVLGLFNPFSGGPCPPRLRVNIYRPGCQFECKFCYVWQGREPRPDRGLLSKLRSDIDLAKEYGLARRPVMVSCSSDPFQPMDRKHGLTAKVLSVLVEHGFPIIILTQNPMEIVTTGLLSLLKPGTTLIEITVPSRSTGTRSTGIFHSLAPMPEARFEAMKIISDAGFNTRLRLDPLVPNFGEAEGIGQTEDDITELVGTASDAGARMVVSKTMVLTPELSRGCPEQLIQFYEKYSALHSSGVRILTPEIQQRLLIPVYAACRSNRIPFCNCVSSSSFDNASSCAFPS